MSDEDTKDTNYVPPRESGVSGPHEVLKRPMLPGENPASYRALTNPAFVKHMGHLKKGDRLPSRGRPKSLPRFRKFAREAAFEVLAEIRRRMSDPDVPLTDLVRAFAEISDRGGYINYKDEGELETMKAKLVLAAFALEGLTPEQKAKLIGAIEGE